MDQVTLQKVSQWASAHFRSTELISVKNRLIRELKELILAANLTEESIDRNELTIQVRKGMGLQHKWEMVSSKVGKDKGRRSPEQIEAYKEKKKMDRQVREICDKLIQSLFKEEIPPEPVVEDESVDEEDTDESDDDDSDGQGLPIQIVPNSGTSSSSNEISTRAQRQKKPLPNVDSVYVDTSTSKRCKHDHDRRKGPAVKLDDFINVYKDKEIPKKQQKPLEEYALKVCKIVYESPSGKSDPNKEYACEVLYNNEIYRVMVMKVGLKPNCKPLKRHAIKKIVANNESSN